MIMIDKFAQDLATLDASGQTFVLGFMTGLQYGNTQKRDVQKADRETDDTPPTDRDQPKSEWVIKA